jgi:UDPglucose 6-dehydrogenase
MKITVVGCGYVGLVTAAGLANFGHLVTGVDRNRNKIDKLRHKELPFYEKGLIELVRKNLEARRLYFTTSLGLAIANSQVIFIAVGTPTRPGGSADLEQVEAVAKEIAAYLRDYTVIVNKSTVPVGTGERVKKLISRHSRLSSTFDVVSNPEFLREGSAVADFTFPDRIIIGADSTKALKIMEQLYAPFIENNIPLIRTNLATAEMIKYASNAFLATKISFINEMADLCETVDVDLPTVAQGMGLDQRIGPDFLSAGPGYGGSCFPKDTKALIHLARKHGKNVSIVEATDQVNERTKKRMLEKILNVVGVPNGKTIAVLGLAFKANTDDLRESPAIPIIRGLLAAGAKIHAHDPLALQEAKKIFGEEILYFNHEYEAVTGTDAIVVTTEWETYLQLDFKLLKEKMKQAILIDLRNLFPPEKIKEYGFIYEGIGRGIK